MKENNTSEVYSGPHFILNHDRLQPGDIILERGYERHSELICKHTKSNYSHAMIYVGGTIIEATREGGVFSRIPNRSTVRDLKDFKVLRLNSHPGEEVMNKICMHARNLSGSQYSIIEALKVKGLSFLKQFSEDDRKQFCSRVVAQSFNKFGIKLVNDINFCSPGDIERSKLLYEVIGMVHQASAEEEAHALEVSPHSFHTKCTVNFVREALKIFESHGIKTLGTSDGEVVITTLSDITMAVYQNSTCPGLDESITDAMISSGYLDHIDIDRKKNPYRYDSILFRLAVEQEANGNQDILFEILRQEINKEAEVYKVRLQSFIAGKENLRSGLKYAKAEYRIPEGLTMGILERTIIIENYTSNKRNTPGFREINDKCREIIKTIEKYAPELIRNLKK